MIRMLALFAALVCAAPAMAQSLHRFHRGTGRYVGTPGPGRKARSFA